MSESTTELKTQDLIKQMKENDEVLDKKMKDLREKQKKALALIKQK